MVQYNYCGERFRGMSTRIAGLFCIFFIAAIFSGCAAKKVQIYEQTTDLRNNIVHSAINLHGKPYKSGAKGPDAFDCSGFIHYVYKKWGVILPVTTDGLIRIGYEINNSNVQPGDLVFFKIKKELHTGIMLNRKEFIHASRSRGVAIDNIEAVYWRKGLIGYRCVL